jgi:hypothetical protein
MGPEISKKSANTQSSLPSNSLVRENAFDRRESTTRPTDHCTEFPTARRGKCIRVGMMELIKAKVRKVLTTVRECFPHCPDDAFGKKNAGRLTINGHEISASNSFSLSEV